MAAEFALFVSALIHTNGGRLDHVANSKSLYSFVPKTKLALPISGSPVSATHFGVQRLQLLHLMG
jgi:hypothetical protein